MHYVIKSYPSHLKKMLLRERVCVVSFCIRFLRSVTQSLDLLWVFLSDSHLSEK